MNNQNLKSEKENTEVEDYEKEEIIEFLKDKMTKKQVINVAFMLSVFSVIFLVSMFISMFPVSVWKDVVFNFVTAFFVVSGICTLGKLVYELVNQKISKKYPTILTEKEKNNDLPAAMVPPRRGRPKKDTK